MDSSTTDLSRFRTDLIRYAKIADTEFNAEAVDPLLDHLGDLYSSGMITVRTTTEDASKRSVNFRYATHKIPHNAVERLESAGILKRSGRQVECLADELIRTFPLWWGVDSSVGHGFEKIWAFFEDGVPLDNILALDHLPEAVRENRDHLIRYGLEKVYIVGLDFRNQSVNLYSGIAKGGHFTPGEVRSLMSDLSYQIPTEEELRRNADTFQYYYTFTWDSPAVRRLCFAMTASMETFPAHWHPLAEKFHKQAPVLPDQRALIFNTTYGPKGGYLKMEADYTGTAATTIFDYWDK
ncbi:aromatic prenyltransferase [Streptomyces flaveolus]|uniref:aromatic prenyltransferase n=1 Tax=Streptomyces flaveolus TaxID=67297 RepID=UPI0037032400